MENKHTSEVRLLNVKNAISSDPGVKTESELNRLVAMIGKPVRITRLSLEGEVEEVIFCRKDSVVFKIKCWINEEVFLYVVTDDEFTLLAD